MDRVAKITWILLAGLAISLSVIGIPIFYVQLQGPCTVDVAVCDQMLIPTTKDLAELQAQGWSGAQYALVYTVGRSLQTLVWVLIGLLIFLRKSNDRGALIISLALILWQTGDGRLAVANAYPGLFLPIQFVEYLATLALPFLLITFPDGRVVPRAMWLMIAFWAAFFFADAIKLTDRNSEAYFIASTISWLGLLVTGIASQIYRYFRVSTPTQRQQTKWVVLGWSVFFILLLVFAVPRISDKDLSEQVSLTRLEFLLVVNSITLLLPISIGVAILRSRLWDIDVIIRRTLTFALVTALLAAVFFGSVIVLQQLFAGLTGSGQNEIVTVLSTLAIAAMFVPLRNWVQSAIDRRFNRKRYNAQQVLADFATTVRDETDLDKLTARLMQVMDETMQPKTVSVWLKKPREQPGNKRWK